MGDEAEVEVGDEAQEEAGKEAEVSSIDIVDECKEEFSYSCAEEALLALSAIR